MKVALAFVALAAISQIPASAKCAMQELVPHVITTATAKIPADGGVLVGFEHQTSRDYNSDTKGDPSAHADWKFVEGKTKVETAMETLAPGLTVYRPKSGTKITLAAPKATWGTFDRDAKATAAPSGVPRATKIVVTTHRSGRGSARTATATSSDPIPPDAVAVIMYTERAKKQVPISWGLLPKNDPKNREFVPWSDPHRCAWNPQGMTAPTTGEKVTLAWVDAFGRVSKPSAPIVVTEIKPGKDIIDDD